MTLSLSLHGGMVLPAHPLALDEQGHIDDTAQRAVSRYHLDAGADGLAVGVHTTQFELHDDLGLLRHVWELAADVAAEHKSNPILIAGLTGDTDRAVAEADLAAELRYPAALLSPWGMADGTEGTLLHRGRA